MLSKILSEFRQTDGPVDLRDLSQRLDIDRSALEGMLETLVRQGKLKEITSEGCARCDRSGTCAHGEQAWAQGKVYALVE